MAQGLAGWDGKECVAPGLECKPFMPGGLGFPEELGRWSLGKRSCIKFMPTPALAALTAPLLRIRGRYFGPQEMTEVCLNGVSLGRYELVDARISLPVAALAADYVVLELLHQQPLRPADMGDSADQREIKFGLESIAIG